jgi:hypothetical protein
MELLSCLSLLLQYYYPYFEKSLGFFLTIQSIFPEVLGEKYPNGWGKTPKACKSVICIGFYFGFF